MDKSVLLVNQYFWPDMAATAQLLGDLAEDLVRSGWEVNVLSGTGAYVSSHEGRLPGRETWNGVKIRRAPCTSFGRATRLGRIVDYLTFLVSAAWVVVTGPKHPVVVCLSTPPFISSLGLLARLRGSRFVYKVEDLYPDVAIALGHLRPNAWITQTLRRVSTALLRRADAVVALDEPMSQVLEQRGASCPVVIPNWADGHATYPDPQAGLAARQRFDWEADRLIVLYSGNLGLAHRFDALLEAAASLQAELPAVKLVFVGAGPRREEVLHKSNVLPNVELHPYQPRESLHALYNAADVHVVSLRNNVEGLLVPSKYAAALAVGKPVLLLGGEGSHLAEEITRREVGWVCDHEACQISAVLAELTTKPAARAEAGQRARRLFLDRYERRRNIDLWIDLLSRQLSESTSMPAEESMP